jgi:hypothetical protein
MDWNLADELPTLADPSFAFSHCAYQHGVESALYFCTPQNI